MKSKHEEGEEENTTPQKRSLKEKFHFLIFGKYAEPKEEDDDDNDEISKTKKKTKKSKQEILFTKKTHMTLEEAEQRVKKWNKAGEEKKVEKGVKLILEYFPDHRFKRYKAFANKTKQKQLKEKVQIEEEVQGKEKVKSLFTKVATNPAHGFDVSAEFLEKNHLPQEADINDDERVFGAISYFPLLSLFVLITRKDSAFAMYHAWQGFAILAIFLVSLPFYWILTLIPGVILFFYIFYIMLLGVSLYAGILAWSGRYIRIPVISGFAMKLAGK